MRDGPAPGKGDSFRDAEILPRAPTAAINVGGTSTFPTGEAFAVPGFKIPAL